LEPEPQQQGDSIMAGFATPPLPATPGEFITALSHFHRAEIARMATVLVSDVASYASGTTVFVDGGMSDYADFSHGG